MKLTFVRIDYDNGTRICADSGAPGMARMRAVCDLPDQIRPELAATRLREFADALDAMSAGRVRARDIHPGGTSES